MIDDKIIKEATEAFNKNLGAGCYVGSLLGIINHLKAEIERLEKENEVYKETNLLIAHQRDERDKEIDELQDREIELESLVEELQHGLTTTQEVVEITKSETYKECIEKVKPIISEMVDIMFDDNESKCRIKGCRYPSNIPCGNEICLAENKTYWNSKLDNLLKEKVGEGEVQWNQQGECPVTPKQFMAIYNDEEEE